MSLVDAIEGNGKRFAHRLDVDARRNGHDDPLCPSELRLYRTIVQQRCIRTERHYVVALMET
jgi:hypothetical protein